MNKNSQQLIDHLKSLKQERKALNELLQADPNGAYVYYLAAYPNVVKIFDSGGILPRNAARDYIDLSFHRIQNIRHKEIALFGNENSVLTNLHNCINLFLNPINPTFYQFRRNAVVYDEFKNNHSSLLCILEIDLIYLLNSNHFFWGVSNRNLTSSHAHLTQNYMEYKNFNWKKIYHINEKNNGKKNTEKHSQSAEFLLHSEEVNENFIPVLAIKRVLILKDDVKNNLNIPNKSKMTLYSTRKNYLYLEDRLNHDKDFVNMLYQHFNTNNDIESIVTNVVIRMLLAEKEIGSSLVESYENEEIAWGYHGVGHTIRVMFWVLFLSEISNSKGYTIQKEETTAAYFAAFAHDLCREDDGDSDEKHGERAEIKIRERFFPKLNKILLPKCLRAIRLHSYETDNNPKDNVLRLLKDADALDRGRFASPLDKLGCDMSFLRLQLFKDEESEQLLWAAYRLAKITEYCNYSINPFIDFFDSILKSFDAVASHNSKKLANKIRNEVEKSQKGKSLL